MSRRSLSSNLDIPPSSLPARRQGGERHSASDRVVFTVGDKTIDGWALNKSHGGLRAIVDEVIELGTEAKVSVGDAAARPCRIVWIQEEPDGAIVGLEFLDIRGSVPNFRALGAQDAAAPPAEGSGEGRGAEPPAGGQGGERGSGGG